jgi:hypothetical protein
LLQHFFASAWHAGPGRFWHQQGAASREKPCQDSGWNTVLSEPGDR